MSVRFDESARWLVLDRGSLLVAGNLADREQTVALGRTGTWKVERSWPAGVVVEEGTIRLPPDGVVVLTDEP